MPALGRERAAEERRVRERVRRRELADGVEEDDVGAGRRRPSGQGAPPDDGEAGLGGEPVRRVEVVGLARRKDEKDGSLFREAAAHVEDERNLVARRRARDEDRASGREGERRRREGRRRRREAVELQVAGGSDARGRDADVDEARRVRVRAREDARERRKGACEESRRAAVARGRALREACVREEHRDPSAARLVQDGGPELGLHEDEQSRTLGVEEAPHRGREVERKRPPREG